MFYCTSTVANEYSAHACDHILAKWRRAGGLIEVLNDLADVIHEKTGGGCTSEERTKTHENKENKGH